MRSKVRLTRFCSEDRRISQHPYRRIGGNSLIFAGEARFIEFCWRIRIQRRKPGYPEISASPSIGGGYPLAGGGETLRRGFASSILFALNSFGWLAGFDIASQQETEACLRNSTMRQS
jgi:hypothetical protein